MNITIGTGMTVSGLNGSTGAVLYILVQGASLLNGTFNLSSVVLAGNRTGIFSFGNETIISPGVNSSSGQVNGFGNGGMGGGACQYGGSCGDNGGVGGTGGYPIGTGGLGKNQAGSISINGSNSSGGGGWAYGLYGGSFFGGNGSGTYGGSGGNAYITGSTAIRSSAGGGGGAGGISGKAGVNIVIKSNSLITYAIFDTSGTSGGNGGNGGNAVDGTDHNEPHAAKGGAGGSGGSGGNAGYISFTYIRLIDNSTKIMLGGTAGNGGIAGTSVYNADNASNGTAGINGTAGTFISNQTGSVGGNVTCGDALDFAGVYTLNASTSINGATCFSVSDGNVTLDCKGFSIIGDNTTNTFGIYSDQANTVIKNCNISNFNVGIYINGSSAKNANIQNNTITITNNNSVDPHYASGIIFYNGANGTIYGNNVSSDAGFGVFLYGSHANVMNNNRMLSGEYALTLSTSENNSVSNNYVNSSGDIGVYIDTAKTNTFTNNTVASTASAGLYYSSSSGNIWNGGMAYAANSTGVYFYTSANNTMANTSIISGSSLPAYFGENSTGNTFYNNTLVSSSGVQTLLTFVASAGGNKIYLNNFTATSGIYVYDLNGSNFYNGTYAAKNQGNIYANVMNGTVLVAGSVASSFTNLYLGNHGQGYPYNNSTSDSKLLGNIVDYAPLTSLTNLAPVDPSVGNFTDAAIGHWFTANGTVTDYDNGSNIAKTNMSITAGSYVYLSNSTSGNNFYVKYNCTGTAKSTPAITIGFTDANGAYASNVSSHAYPDHAASLTVPSVTAVLNTNSSATCTNGSYSDLDNDLENVSARTFTWYKNGAVESGQQVRHGFLPREPYRLETI
jgi:parallel beta-helix repeat protein